MTKKSLYPLLLLALLLSVFWILLKAGEDKADLFPATVVRISEEYANINTDVDLDDLSARGISHGTVFKVNFRGRTLNALLGKGYSDVPRGE